MTEPGIITPPLSVVPATPEPWRPGNALTMCLLALIMAIGLPAFQNCNWFEPILAPKIPGLNFWFR